MLQIDIKPYASDALEDAMRLAQVKAMNSYTFSDCFNYLNYVWSDIYNRLACIDAGYYSKVVRLTQRMTKLPPYVNNTLLVFRAARPTDRRQVYKQAGNNDQCSCGEYRISGTDLYCPDAESCSVWMEYSPNPPQLFFPMYNRDPKIWLSHDTVIHKEWGIFKLVGDGRDDWEYDDIPDINEWVLHNRADMSGQNDVDITERLQDIPATDLWHLCYISCDFPYIFVTYKHSITGEHLSGFLTKELEWEEYNPFAYMGRNSNVEYIDCKWNDKTGMGVIIKDWNDMDGDEPKIKELGWTPDTMLIYPNPCVYRYLVARLAEKFAVMNESNIMGVEDEVQKSRYAFEAFVDKNKAAFKRINIVTGPTIDDLL